MATTTHMNKRIEVPGPRTATANDAGSQEPRRRRRARLTYAAGAVGVAVGMAVAGAAAAYYSIGGASTALVHVGSDTAPVEFSTEPVSGLGPGETVTMTVDLSNPGTEPVEVVTLETTLPKRADGCPLDDGLLDFEIVDALPVLQPGGSDRVRVLVSMSPAAPQTCQAVSVPVTLVIQGVVTS